MKMFIEIISGVYKVGKEKLQLHHESELVGRYTTFELLSVRSSWALNRSDQSMN